MNITLTPEHSRETPAENPTETITGSSATRQGLRRTLQTETLPDRLDVHRLRELEDLCTTNLAHDLLLDASEVRFVDTAALAFLETLDTTRRTAGAVVRYLRPSPALAATFELHRSKLADPELMVR